MQRLIETRLRHMVDTCNVGQRHPGVHSAHVAAGDTLVILLKLLVSLNGACGRKKHTGQRQGQKQADEQKFHAYFQANLLSPEHIASIHNEIP